MLWNKTDLDGLKKEVTSFSDTFCTFLTAHTNTTNIISLWNDFKSGCLDIMNRYIPTDRSFQVLVHIDLVEMDGW
jgi:hypothetical protein